MNAHEERGAARMDPEISAALAALPPVDFVDPVARRASFERFRATLPPVPPDPRVVTQDHHVSRDDDSILVVRSYRPVGATGVLPVVMWFHGGGFVYGSVDFDDHYCAELAVRTNAVVFSPEYRLAPEHRFPAGVDDCYTATCWAAERAHEVQSDGSRLAVAGGSAGGNLAAAVSLMARDRGGPRISFQALLSAVLDTVIPHPYLRMSDRATMVVIPEDHDHMTRHYLGDQTDDVSPYAMPARSADLSGLPPAYVLACGLDYLRQSAVDYAVALDRAGVPVELHLVPEVPHGFDGIAMHAPTSQSIIAEYTSAMARALSESGTSQGGVELA